MEPQILKVCLGESPEYPAPRRYARQVYIDHAPGRLDDVRVDLPGAVVTWVGDAGGWPELEPGAPGDPAALRAVLVFRERGDTLVELADSDDRAVTFLVDAPTPEELDAMEERVRSAVRLDVTPLDATLPAAADDARRTT
jgi:hypothetical protein